MGQFGQLQLRSGQGEGLRAEATFHPDRVFWVSQQQKRRLERSLYYRRPSEMGKCSMSGVDVDAGETLIFK